MRFTGIDGHTPVDLPGVDFSSLILPSLSPDIKDELLPVGLPPFAYQPGLPTGDEGPYPDVKVNEGEPGVVPPMETKEEERKGAKKKRKARKPPQKSSPKARPSPTRPGLNLPPLPPESLTTFRPPDSRPHHKEPPPLLPIDVGRHPLLDQTGQSIPSWIPELPSNPLNLPFDFITLLSKGEYAKFVKPIMDEIFKSIRCEPISLDKPKSKNEVRCRYRVLKCSWKPLEGLRYMRSFSMSKYGEANCWALSRACVYFMQTFKTLPFGFVPVIASRNWDDRIEKEFVHYMVTRIGTGSGPLNGPFTMISMTGPFSMKDYGYEAPPVPPLIHVPRTPKGSARGRKRKTNVGPDLLFQSYLQEQKERDRVEKQRLERQKAEDSI